ncbi:MAG: TolC family protein [Gemmatimonadota bacterium]|nr:TolC family protein [Gemmatimonadota bacterium]
MAHRSGSAAPPAVVLATLAVLAGAWVPRPATGQESPPVGPDTVVVSLRAAEAAALRNHPEVRQAAIDVAISKTRHDQAEHARFFPKLELRNVWGPITRARGEFSETGVLFSPDTANSLSDIRWFTQVELEALQPIHTFGRVDGLIDAAESGVQASQAGLAASTAEVRLQVRRLYWGVVLGEELVALGDDVLETLAEAEDILEQRDAEGSVSQNDLFRFEILSYQVHKRYREGVDRLELARAGLRAAMGLEPDVPIRPEAESLEVLEARLSGLGRYLDLAQANRPEVDRLEAGIAARASLARSKRAEQWPQLFLGAQLVWNVAPSRFDPENPFVYNPTNFFRPGVVVGFNWNANVFRTRDEARLAEHEQARLESGVQPLREKIRLEVREAFLEASRAAADLEESRRALRASENWFRAEQQTFDIGVGELSDLVDAFQANVEMRTDHLQNIFNYNAAVAKLSRAVGVDVHED